MKIGLGILLVGVVCNALIDLGFRKGKIKEMKELFKYKMAALAVAIVGAVLLIVFKI